jgi:hypothetical protein
MLVPHKTLLARIARCEASAENAHDAMYETRYPAGEYSDLKDCFSEARPVPPPLAYEARLLQAAATHARRRQR